MPSATRMNNQFGIWKGLHHRARAARVIQVNVGQNNVVDRIDIQSKLFQCRQCIRYSVIGAGIDESNMAVLHDQVNSGENRPHITRVERDNSVAVSLQSNILYSYTLICF
jgi:hypothetical protein